MENLELVIAESIKKGKWIDISYKNNKNEITYYWIAVNDIDLKSRKISATCFNDQKSLECLNIKINFDNILSAKILDFSTYETPIELINKIEKNREDAKWLKYENFNNNILRYYLKCNELDNDPYQKDAFLISGIDKSVLLNKKEITLNDSQEKEVLNYIKKYDKNNKKEKQTNKINYFILSTLSIEESNKKYVVLYYDIKFNPITKKLSIIDTPRINQSFLIENKKHSIGYYIDIDPNEFVYNITNNTDTYLPEYTELIRENLRNNEIINELPEFMILQRAISAKLEETYNIIEEKHKNEPDKLERPLKAFFGNVNRYGSRKTEPNIVIYDNKVNIDQMRVIYNSMKYPITYVQGPPGTGKTQTILNVVLSAFFNERTTLICSSNNKPIDGILEKLCFTYKNKNDIPFPYLRLGNRSEVAKSTKRILELYNYQSTMNPDEEKINKIKELTNNGNKELINTLKSYEEKLSLKLKIDSAKKLVTSINNKNNRLYQNTIIALENLIKEYNSIPTISNEDVLKLVSSVSDDYKFKQYLYFESLNYIQKLKQPKYQELINICTIEDDEDRSTEFNKWCAKDDNMTILKRAFPVIITTNISASRLGTPNSTFDLVIMDEAGQCNCASALLPIARAKQLLLVGDSNQLKPVIVLEDTINDNLKEEYNISDDYDYNKNSILDIMRKHDSISKDIMLTYHYRCGKKIINYSNQRFYNGKLNLEFLKDEGNISLVDVQNINSQHKNEHYEESKAIVDLIVRNNYKDVAIITPFKNQEKLINSMLRENNIDDISCSTIHQIQGGEKNTIILSPAISPKTSEKTFEWLKNNSELINVAVTRAKQNLIIVTDVEALEKLSKNEDNDLSELVKYISSNGTTEVIPNESYSIQIGKSNGSKNEDTFFKTISHFCSVNSSFTAKRNISVASLFSTDQILSKSKQEFDIVIYERKNQYIIPRIVIELNGGEHIGNIDREKCDARKSQICKEKNIKLLIIENSFIKSYETIKKLILESCGLQIEQLELF